MVCPEDTHRRFCWKLCTCCSLLRRTALNWGGGREEKESPPGCVEKKYRSCQKCTALSLQNLSFTWWHVSPIIFNWNTSLVIIHKHQMVCLTSPCVEIVKAITAVLLSKRLYLPNMWCQNPKDHDINITVSTSNLRNFSWFQHILCS